MQLKLAFLLVMLGASIPGHAREGDAPEGESRITGQCVQAEDTLNFPSADLVKNGWFQQDGRVIWGFFHNSSIWGGLRTPGDKWFAVAKVEGPNITRHDPDRTGPLFTEDLDSLSSSLKQYGFPGLIHHYGIWYDRRRDAHDLGPRSDSNAVPPFLEMPWARSDTGRASDGLPEYDLTHFNPWYFDRLTRFAKRCDQKGLIFFFDFYQQHILTEIQAHYEDFPWRPGNNIQNVSLPDKNPAADAFYAVATPLQRKLHRLYIRKCLDELGSFRNVVFCLSEEYTGPESFVDFWLDEIRLWENETGRKVQVALGATKDVTEAVLADPERASMIGTIDMSRWWYDRDGTLFAPPGGKEVPGRYLGRVNNTSPEQVYRLVNEYRMRYPSMALLHSFSGSHEQLWAFLMAGGSMLMADFIYPDALPPKKPFLPPSHYIAPAKWPVIETTYRFINSCLSTSLWQMTPCPYVISNPKDVWALGDKGRDYLIYALHGGAITFGLPETPGKFVAHWFNPRTGAVCRLKDPVAEGQRITIIPPGGGGTGQDWVLWLSAESTHEVKSAINTPSPECKTPPPLINANDTLPTHSSPQSFGHHIGEKLMINFQPSGVTPPIGYLEDNGDLYGEREGFCFGWQTDHSGRMLYKAQTPPARRAPDIRLQTFCDAEKDAVWEAKVENGDYLVRITAGDPRYPSYCTVNVEGVQFWDAKTLYTNEFATLERRVTVTDGRLTIEAKGGEQHSVKLCSVIITAAVNRQKN